MDFDKIWHMGRKIPGIAHKYFDSESMNKEDDHTNDNEEQKIDITESNDTVTEAQDEEGTSSKPEDGKVDLTEIKVENNVNPLLYEIGPFPRKPQRVWVQYIGPHPDAPLTYDSSQNDFVKLVFSLVLVMLICTAGYVFFCHSVPSVKNMFLDRQTGKLFLFVALFTATALGYAFACSGCTRSAPCSYICLGITVIAYGVICSYFTIILRTHAVFVALIATCVVVMVCLGLAFTSFDFTRFILYVIVAMAALCAASLASFLFMAISGQHIKLLHVGFIIAGTVLHAICLVIELQMVLGGRSVELSEDDYAFGAFSIYTSVVNIFLNLLQLMSMEDIF